MRTYRQVNNETFVISFFDISDVSERKIGIVPKGLIMEKIERNILNIISIKYYVKKIILTILYK